MYIDVGLDPSYYEPDIHGEKRGEMDLFIFLFLELVPF
jgi:hypothetical protein